MECRLCLSGSPNNWIFSFNSEIVQNILSILKISTNDGLPEHICDDCAKKLIDIEEFIKKCEENNEYLRKSLIKQEILEKKYLLDKELIVVIHDNVDQLLKQGKCNKILEKKNEEYCFICEMCQQKFTDDIAFQNHLKEHVQKEFCMCGFCFKRFRFEDELEQHYVEKHECSYCHRLTKSRRRHELRFHHKNPQSYVCTICGKVSRILHHHEMHMKSKHSKFECDICHVVCSTKWNIISHMRTHFPKPVKCKECKKTFKRRDSLRVHMQHFHWMTKPRLNCELCKKSFLTKGNLKEHMFQHSKDKRFECDYCSKRYYSKNALGKHIKINHLHKTVYRCRTCRQTFASKQYRNFHEAVHKNSVPYRCTVCPKKLILKPSMWCHLKTIHKDLNSVMLMKDVMRQRKKEI